ncbi:MAG: Hsp20/alpha crystallin family protein [Gammaproteobacteria bacterium]
MTLVLQDPWSVVNRFQNEISRLVHDRAWRADDDSPVASRWAPAVDIAEERDRYILRADIPGVAPESIEITMDNGVLTLQGERKEEVNETKAGARRVERVFGAFYRRFALPDGVDAERIVARGDNGVLEISIPKVEKAKLRRIEVQH